MSEEELGTFQMLWDCSACDMPKLLGLTHRYCPTCGSAQDPKQRYFPEEGEGVLVENHVFTGRDKICPACDTPVSAQASHCPSCGCGLEEAKEVGLRSEQSAGEGETFEGDTAKAARADFKAQKQANQPETVSPPAEESQSNTGKLIFFGAIAAVIIAVIIFFSWTESVNLTASGKAWSRIIHIEQFRTLFKSAWKTELPVKAYSVTCRQEKRGTKKVPDGETCTTVRKDQGNGTFKKVKKCKTKYKAVPTYADKCRYKIDAWSKVRSVKTSQQDTDEPVWPQFRLAKEGKCLGCERAGAKEQTYKVFFKMKDTEESCSFSQTKWASIDKGSQWTAETRVLGGGLDCESLQPATTSGN